MSETTNEDFEVYCPEWSRVFGTKTKCIKENCSKYIPPENYDGEEWDGLCSDVATTNCLSAISVSLAILSGQIEVISKENTTEAKGKPEDLYG